MDVPVDYHVWGTMLEYYQRHTQKLAKAMPIWKIVLSTIQNDLHHEFIDKAIVSIFNWFRSCVAATGGHWHCEHSV